MLTGQKVFVELFERLPVRDQYRAVHHNAITLACPSTLARLFFLFEAFLYSSVFAVSYWYSATSSTTETVVTYEVQSSYSCAVLSPRSDETQFSISTSELVQFSRARYTYDQCFTALTSTYDVCSSTSGVRDELLLTVTGVSTNSSVCQDILLANSTRFCYGGEEKTTVAANSAIVSSSFPRQGGAPDATYSTGYYYANQSGVIYPVSTGSTLVVSSDFVSGLDQSIFVAGNIGTGPMILYEFHPSYTTFKSILTFDGGSVYGVAASDKGAYALVTSQSSTVATITVYNRTTGTVSTLGALPSGVTFTGVDSSATYARFLSYGYDNSLLAMVSTSSTSGIFTFYKFHATTGSRSTININLGSYGSSTATIWQVLYSASDSSIYIVGGRPGYSLLKATINGTTTEAAAYVGTWSGYYAIMDDTNNRIYFSGSENRTYLDIASQTFQTLSVPQYYTATAVQIAFRYQVCDGNATDYTLEADSTTSFSGQCGEINGIYYQSNTFLSVEAGSNCSGWISSTTNAEDILNCPAVAQATNGWIEDACVSSIANVCAEEFTDNPPFSCSRQTHPGWITNLATGLANAGGAWSFFCIIMKIVCKICWPHGYKHADYDVKKERFISHNEMLELLQIHRPLPTHQIEEDDFWDPLYKKKQDLPEDLELGLPVKDSHQNKQHNYSNFKIVPDNFSSHGEEQVHD